MSGRQNGSGVASTEFWTFRTVRRRESLGFFRQNGSADKRRDVEPPERFLLRDVLAAKSKAVTELARARLKLVVDGRPLEGEWSGPEPLPDRQGAVVRRVSRSLLAHCVGFSQ